MRWCAGKGHNFRCIASLIDGVLTPKWGDMQISAITEHMLNDWVQDDYRVEDAAATVAAHGRQSKESTRNIIYKRPAATTLPTRATRDGISQPAKLPAGARPPATRRQPQANLGAYHSRNRSNRR